MCARQHVRIEVAYDGREFFGSQRQPGVRTVQGELEAAIARVTGNVVGLAFAGRTDRGVHALGQVASGTVQWSQDLERFRFALDSLTGNDLRVRTVAQVKDRFHARFDARAREYRYWIYEGRPGPVLLRNVVWETRQEHDLVRLNRASRELIGTQDFRSLAGAGTGTDGSTTETIRRIDLADWRELPNQLEPPGRILEFRVVGNAFLPHMVRNIVGALIDSENDDRPDEQLRTLLALRDRKQAPPPAPAHGLTLWQVTYDSHLDNREPGQNAGLEQE